MVLSGTLRRFLPSGRKVDATVVEQSLRPALPLPDGVTEDQILEFMLSMELADAPRQEMENYCRQDWRRFVYTFGLVRDLQGRCLELGANPYFTTMLLKRYTSLDLTLANYFGPDFQASATQHATVAGRGSGARDTVQFPFVHFNCEQERFPFDDATFDVVLFCEILEHLQLDPVGVLREINRVLKPGGHLVLTTPNVARLENVAKLITGANIYDPYSGYGAYGRHNREYTRHELAKLLEYCGFQTEQAFTADVHGNPAADYLPLESFAHLVSFRQHDLGQYLFTRSRRVSAGQRKRPQWLFRSFGPDELE
jgi:SAM-dependent methyltransferase